MELNLNIKIVDAIATPKKKYIIKRGKLSKILLLESPMKKYSIKKPKIAPYIMAYHRNIMDNAANDFRLLLFIISHIIKI